MAIYIRLDEVPQDKLSKLSWSNHGAAGLKPSFILPHPQYILNYNIVYKYIGACLAHRSVMDCNATARGSILGGNGVFTELHVLRKRR